MKKFANLKIGKKLSLVLGACVFLLFSMAGLALWGNRTIAKYEADSRDRLTKCLLAEQVSSGAGSATLYVGAIAQSKRSAAAERDELLQVRKDYLAALEGFKARVNTPKSRQHAADMEQLIQEFIAVDNRILEVAAAGNQAKPCGSSRVNPCRFRRPCGRKSAEAREVAGSSWSKQRTGGARRLLHAFGWR